MKRLLWLLLATGCMSTSVDDPNHPMPTCDSPAQCDAMWQAGKDWLFAHPDYNMDVHYTDIWMKSFNPHSALEVQMHREPSRITVRVTCASGGFSACSPDQWTTLDDITAKINAAGHL